MHDVQDLFLAENRVFLLDHIHDAVTTDIEGIGIDLPHHLPAGAGRVVCRALPGIFGIALHDLPTGPICIH